MHLVTAFGGVSQQRPWMPYLNHTIDKTVRQQIKDRAKGKQMVKVSVSKDGKKTVSLT